MSRYQTVVAALGMGLGIVALAALVSWILPTGLTNQQIVEQTKYCKDNGMDADRTLNGFNYNVTSITCIEKRTK